jgi:hypothetical protein
MAGTFVSLAGQSAYENCSAAVAVGSATCPLDQSCESLLGCGVHLLFLWILSDGVTTLAGSGLSSYGDGVGTFASFNQPNGIARHPTMFLVVADTANNRIRSISSSGDFFEGLFVIPITITKPHYFVRPSVDNCRNRVCCLFEWSWNKFCDQRSNRNCCCHV